MNVVRAEDWPHGLRCMDCERILEDGDQYSERLRAVLEGVPAVEITCVPCAIGLPEDQT